eukprot:1195308-Prorocentrum_minimum.AAC.1
MSSDHLAFRFHTIRLPLLGFWFLIRRGQGVSCVACLPRGRRQIAFWRLAGGFGTPQDLILAAGEGVWTSQDHHP